MKSCTICRSSRISFTLSTTLSTRISLSLSVSLQSVVNVTDVYLDLGPIHNALIPSEHPLLAQLMSVIVVFRILRWKDLFKFHLYITS